MCVQYQKGRHSKSRRSRNQIAKTKEENVWLPIIAKNANVRWQKKERIIYQTKWFFWVGVSKETAKIYSQDDFDRFWDWQKKDFIWKILIIIFIYLFIYFLCWTGSKEAFLKFCCWGNVREGELAMCTPLLPSKSSTVFQTNPTSQSLFFFN